MYIKLKAEQKLACHTLYIHSRRQHFSDALKSIYISFDFRYNIFVSARQKLYHVPSRCLNGIVNINKHSQRHNRRRLLRIHKIVRNILCNLTCLKFNPADIGLFHS